VDHIFKKLLEEPSHHGSQIIDLRLLINLKTINPKAIFNFLKFKKPKIRDWKRKKRLIKERE